MTLQNLISLLLLGSGTFFMLAGSIGVIRLPDFYTRTHAAGKTDTLGIILVLAGLAVYEGLTLTSGKLVIAMLFVLLVNPVAAHALAQAAMHVGLKPWFRPGSSRGSEDES